MHSILLVLVPPQGLWTLLLVQSKHCCMWEKSFRIQQHYLNGVQIGVGTGLLIIKDEVHVVENLTYHSIFHFMFFHEKFQLKALLRLYYKPISC